MKNLIQKINTKALAAFCAVAALAGSAFAEGESGSGSDITIDSTHAQDVADAIKDYVTDIMPMLLGIIGAGLGLALIFFVVRLFMRGTKVAAK